MEEVGHHVVIATTMTPVQTGPDQTPESGQLVAGVETYLGATGTVLRKIEYYDFKICASNLKTVQTCTVA